jgi:NAD(P)H dehydrogenase (quinone)
MKIAVTAASGRLGKATLEHLTRRIPRDNVVAVARDPSRIAISDIEKRAGDYQSSEQMLQAFDDIDTVIMISAPVAGGGDRLTMHRAVINAAKQAAVRKLIYTSVIGNELAEGTYFEPFYRVNNATEQSLKESGLEWVIARNGLYLDLDLMHIKHAHEHGGVYRNNAGEGRCGYISIDELGFALARLAVTDTCDGMTVNLFGELYTQAELVAMASAACGLNVRYEAISLEANVARFMQDERIAARGEDVAKMLSGCFQCMDKGVYEVASQYERAAGRPARPVPEQLAKLV